MEFFNILALIGIIALCILIPVYTITKNRKPKSKKSTNRLYRGDTVKTNSNSILKVIIVLLLISVLYLGYLLYSQNQPDPLDRITPSIPTAKEYVNFSETPIPFPRTSSTMREPDLMLYASFRVETILDSEHHYFIRLKHRWNPDSFMDFYIRSGETLETYIPHGEYYFYYSSGKEWYGTEYYFGPKSNFFRADRTILFYWDEDEMISHGRTIQLEPVTDGNLHTQPITFSSFNK